MRLSKTSIVFLTIFQLLSSSVIADNGKHRRTKKSKKAKKDGRKSSQGSNSLVALIEEVGDNEAIVGIIGTSTIRFNADGSFLFAMDMTGLMNDSGTAVVTDGTSCEDISETPFTQGDTFDGVVNVYNALSEGVSKSAFRFNNGYTRPKNMGKTVLIYDNADGVIGCGILGREIPNKNLSANMGMYPNYTGDLSPGGKIKITFHDDDSFKFHYNIKGLEANCVGCGIHVHAGTSCATHEEVKGHGWNSVVVQDLWTATGGATYMTDDMGNANGYFEIYNGFGYEENVNHAVVIHMQDGSRVGCGILM